MSLDMKVNCPMCGAEHIIDEYDLYPEDDSENCRDDPWICWKCYIEREEMQAISEISGILDKLDENGKEHSNEPKQRIIQNFAKQSTLLGRLRSHFSLGSEKDLEPLEIET